MEGNAKKLIELDIRVEQKIEYIYLVKVTEKEAEKIRAGTISPEEMDEILSAHIMGRYWLDDGDFLHIEMMGD